MKTKTPTYRLAYRKHFNAMADALLAQKARPFTVKAVASALKEGNLNQWFDEDRFTARALGRPWTRPEATRTQYRGGPLGLMLARMRRSLRRVGPQEV